MAPGSVTKGVNCSPYWIALASPVQIAAKAPNLAVPYCLSRTRKPYLRRIDGNNILLVGPRGNTGTLYRRNDTTGMTQGMVERGAAPPNCVWHHMGHMGASPNA